MTTKLAFCALLLLAVSSRADEKPRLLAQAAPPIAAFSPKVLNVASSGLDVKGLSAAQISLLEDAFTFDRGDSSAEEKAENWRQLGRDVPAHAAFASTRSEEWNLYMNRRREASEAKRARGAETKSASARKADPSLLGKVTPGKAGLEWVAIPGGKFQMGTNDPDVAWPKPVHEVSIKPFEMTKTLVTFKQYRACVAGGACTAPHVSNGSCFVYAGKAWTKGNLPESMQGDDQPAVCLEIGQARAFAKWAGGRLPSESEWEYAARSAGKAQRFPWGNEEATCDKAVMDEGGDGCGRRATWPVCAKPNGNTAQGLCDMAGNVWQWVQDPFHRSYVGAPTDGSAWENGGAIQGENDVTKRGGSWRTDGSFLRSAYRLACDPNHRHDYNGFRLAR